VRFTLFSEIYHRFDEGKGRHKALSLIENAIDCIADKGFENVTLEMIARRSGVTRPLLNHYFDDLADIQLTSIKYVRLLFQKFAITQLEKGGSVSEALRLYIAACLLWGEQFKTHAKVWIYYLLLCYTYKRHRQINTLAVQTGEDRLAALLEKGKLSGEFKFEDKKSSAKLIQTIITGAMFTAGCEEISDKESYLKLIQSECLKIVGH
jgi:AcrR family transcriptional regulator